MRRISRCRRLLVLLVALCASGALAHAQATDPEGEPPPYDAATASRPDLASEEAWISGRLGWVFAPDIDLVGRVSADIPWLVRDRRELFLALDTQTVMLRPESSWAFRVLSFDYSVSAGLRIPVGNSLRAVFSAGQDGVEQVDTPGTRALRFAAAGLESAGFRRHTAVSSFEWQAALGPVGNTRHVDVHGVAFGALRYINLDSPIAWGVDARVRSYFGGRDAGTLFEAGPYVALRWPAGREAEIFVHWLRDRTPVGPHVSAVYAGLHLARTGGSAPITGPSPYGRANDEYSFAPVIDDPGMHGLLLGGGGAGRRAARFQAYFSSPPLLSSVVRIAADVDTNILSARDTGELYYLVRTGFQGRCLDWTCGLYWFHRSNHQLSHEGSGHVQSDNVIEVGIDSAGWDRPLELSGEDIGSRFEMRLHAGYVAQTSFLDRRWHTDIGVRWDIPWRGPSLVPFLLWEAEAGDIHRRTFAAGLRTGSGVELRFEHRSDSQFYGASTHASLFLVGGRF